MNLAKRYRGMCGAWGSIGLFCRSLHNSLYFCQTETRSCSTWQNRFPVLLRGSIPNWLLPTILYWSLLCSRNALPDCIITQRLFFERDGSIAGKYRKMHIPDDPAYYEKFYFYSR